MVIAWSHYRGELKLLGSPNRACPLHIWISSKLNFNWISWIYSACLCDHYSILALYFTLNFWYILSTLTLFKHSFLSGIYKHKHILLKKTGFPYYTCTNIWGAKRMVGKDMPTCIYPLREVPISICKWWLCLEACHPRLLH